MIILKLEDASHHLHGRVMLRAHADICSTHDVQLERQAWELDQQTACILKENEMAHVCCQEVGVHKCLKQKVTVQ